MAEYFPYVCVTKEGSVCVCYLFCCRKKIFQFCRVKCLKDLLDLGLLADSNRKKHLVYEFVLKVFLFVLLCFFILVPSAFFFLLYVSLMKLLSKKFFSKKLELIMAHALLANLIIAINFTSPSGKVKLYIGSVLKY